MSNIKRIKKERESNEGSYIRNSTLVIAGFATAFFPRLLSSLGAPSVINFAHFLFIPATFVVVILTSKIRDRQSINAVSEILLGIFLFFTCMVASAVINNAGIVNVFLQLMFQVEPFLFLIAMILVSLGNERLKSLQHWLLGFAAFNLLLAIAQSILLPLGIYPKPQGGTLADNIGGVFGGGAGSAANYVSCTVSFYFALYFWNRFKHLSLWLRAIPFVLALYQIQVSDSKQVFLALAVGWGLLAMTKVKKPAKLLLYVTTGFIAVLCINWVLLNVEAEILKPYQNWINRDIWGWEGLAAQVKFAGLRIVPTYYETPLNWLLGLGPGHTATRLGGWIIRRDYPDLLMPLGATVHPASLDFWEVINTNYLPQESTIYFPMYTWMGIWGDGGLLGLGAYLYLCSVVWRRICMDDFGKFLLLSTASFGFILTQMEEPGQLLTVSCLLGLRWLER